MCKSVGEVVRKGCEWILSWFKLIKELFLFVANLPKYLSQFLSSVRYFSDLYSWREKGKPLGESDFKLAKRLVHARILENIIDQRFIAMFGALIAAFALVISIFALLS